MIAVLGAGISGLSAAFELQSHGRKVRIFEKSNISGGLCSGFDVNGFWFDSAIHLSFASGEGRNFFDQTEVIHHTPDPYNLDRGRWIKHPAQNNLYPLSAEEKTEIIAGFIENRRLGETPNNYEDWLRIQFGDCFAERYPLRYTKKYWRCEANELSVEWAGGRIYQPNLREVLHGAFTENTPVTYYAKEMRYPLEGKYVTFLAPLMRKCEVEKGMELIELDLGKRALSFANGATAEYSRLVSSLPLPELVRATKDAPESLRKAAEALEWTSVRLISFGFRRPDIPNHIWDYYYDEDFAPARSYSPSIKNPRNVPQGTSSLQFETYRNLKREDFGNPVEDLAKVQDFAKRNGIFQPDDIVISDVRDLPYGNVIFLLGMEPQRDYIRDFYNKYGIETVGRFGEWGYLWSDQSYMSGKSAAKKIIAEGNE